MHGMKLWGSTTQTPIRIQKVEPLILDSSTPMVWIMEPEGGSTFLDLLRGLALADS